MEILLVQPDKDVREMMAFTFESQFDATVHRLETPQEAFDLLLEDTPIELIVCNDTKDNLKLFKYLLSVEATIPCLLIQPTNKDEVAAFPDLNVIGRVDITASEEDLKEVMKEVITQGKLEQDKEESDYSRIKTELLIKVVPLQADIYIRLSRIKFVKLFKKGDVFDINDLDRYLKKKKVEYLFLKKDDASAFVNKFKTVLADVLKRDDLTVDQSIELASSVHEAVQELGSQLGFTPEVQSLVKDNVSAVLSGVRKGGTLGNLLQNMEKEPKKYLSSHSVMIAHVACGIAAKMDWSSDTTFEKLTYAALLHDIHLKNHQLAQITTLEELRKSNNSFKPEEIDHFLKHPLACAETAMNFSEIPADVAAIIREHHERPDGSGFPRKLTSARIAPLSAVFIVAHDIVLGHFKNGESIEEFKEKYGDSLKVGNFRKVISALETPEE